MMKLGSHTLLAFFTLVVVAWGCPERKTKNPWDRLVVELIPAGARKAQRSGRITVGEYRLELARVRLEREGTINAAPLPQTLKNLILERMIERRIMILEAERLGVEVSTAAVNREVMAIRADLPSGQYEKWLVTTYQTEDDLRRSIRERLSGGILLEKEAFNGIKVSDEEVQRAWEAEPEENKTRKARVHAAQIVVSTEEDGRDVLRALKKGGEFADLARKRSIAPEGQKGGDLGWFEAGVMPEVFDRVCFSLKPGTVSKLTPSGYGFHIFKVLEIEEERPLTFDEVKASLVDRLKEDRLRRAKDEYLTTLRTRTKVVKHEELIASIE